jgi:hypothetical protein
MKRSRIAKVTELARVVNVAMLATRDPLRGRRCFADLEKRVYPQD